MKAKQQVRMVMVLCLLVSLASTVLASSTVMDNITLSPRVWLDDYVSGYVMLSDTNNMTLEAVECSVVAFENESHRLVKTWDVGCRKGEPYLDDDGNWVTISSTCKISDTQGYYYFTGEVLEKDGFETGRTYLLQFTCSGGIGQGEFYVDVPKPPDASKWFVFGRRYLGIIVLWIIAIALLLIVVVLIRKGVLTF